jgi:hypothetical protein
VVVVVSAPPAQAATRNTATKGLRLINPPLITL